MKFFEGPPEGLLGMTKIFLPGYSAPGGGYVEVEEQEMLLMAWHECVTIVAALSDWSERFGVEWLLTIEGETFGTVLPSGKQSPELEASMAQLLAMSGAVESGEALESRIGTIDAKYASRWE